MQHGALCAKARGAVRRPLDAPAKITAVLSLARGKEGVFRLVSNYRPQGDQPAANANPIKNEPNGPLPVDAWLRVS